MVHGLLAEIRMRKSGTFFIVAGLIGLTFAGFRAPQAQDFSYLMGTLTPGMLLLIVGLMRRQKNQKAEQEAEQQDRDL
jgi:hypothetical protein